jgi:hypothetical protein
MEAIRSFEASEIAPHSTRTETSAHNSNLANRTWYQPKVRPADWTEQFLYRSCSTNDVSAAQWQCDYVNDCSVVNILMVDLFQFQKSKFLLKTAVCPICFTCIGKLWPESVCESSRTASISPQPRWNGRNVWIRVYKEREIVYVFHIRKNLQCGSAMLHNIILQSKLQIISAAMQ